MFREGHGPGYTEYALVYIQMEILNFENATFIHSLAVFFTSQNVTFFKIKNLYWLQVHAIH